MRAVRWRIRDDGNSTFCRHYHGEFIVFVEDHDGDMVVWEVWYRRDYEARNRAWERDPDGARGAGRHFHPQAHGEVSCGWDELEIGKAIAIEALDAIIREKRRSDAERAAATNRRESA